MPKGQPGTLTHGLSAYTNGRCKCEICRSAFTAWRRKKYGMKPLAEYHAETFREHGAAAYRKRGCRCEICRAHMAEVRRAYRKNNPESRERENRKRMERYYAKKQAAA